MTVAVLNSQLFGSGRARVFYRIEIEAGPGDLAILGPENGDAAGQVAAAGDGGAGCMGISQS
jgi:hypothetical protein